jgi:ribonuclease HI
MDKIHLYTDGAFSSSRMMMGYAFVVLAQVEDTLEKLYSEHYPISGGTNNRAEVIAAIEGIKYCKKNNIKDIIVYSDSMYLIGTMSQAWKRKKNIDLWLDMEDTITGLNLEWKHTKGHAGDKWNSYCDMLASAASHVE